MGIEHEKIVANQNARGKKLCFDHSKKGHLVWEDNPQLATILQNLAKMGLSDEQVAIALGITEKTFLQSLAKHPEIEDYLLLGRSEATRKVVESAYKLATGKSVIRKFTKKDGTEVVEYAPASPMMIKYWLNNRDPQNWRDRPGEAAPAKPVENIYNEQDNITRLFGCLPEENSSKSIREPRLPGKVAQFTDEGEERTQDVQGDVQGIPADNLQDDVLDVPDEG